MSAAQESAVGLDIVYELAILLIFWIDRLVLHLPLQ